MPSFSRILQAAVMAGLLSTTAWVHAATCPRILDESPRSLQSDRPQSLCEYAGKVILVVNTASYCGFSPQERGLQELYRKYGPRGLVVLGFASDDFHQEMSNPQRIAPFSHAKYGVQFPLFAPTHVTEPSPNPLFAQLIRATGTQPKWNFYKYLIGRDGKVVAVYSSLTSPSDPRLVEQIRRLLAQRP